MAGILAWETRGPVLTPTCCVASAGFHPFSGPVSLMSQGMVFLDMVTLCGGVSLSLRVGVPGGILTFSAMV